MAGFPYGAAVADVLVPSVTAPPGVTLPGVAVVWAAAGRTTAIENSAA